MMKRVSILGATGSIGQQTLDVIRQHRDKFRVVALAAQQNVEALTAAAKEFQPEMVAIADEAQYQNIKNTLSGEKIEIIAGEEAVIAAARHAADIYMAAIVGMAGLAPTLAAIEQGKTVALANKEALVCAGPLMLDAVRRSGTMLLPVDSEHNAIFQVLEQRNRGQLRKIILTASGGPFREWSQQQIQSATREQALKHPNWNMGAKITIDSASMMNKGLEFIEAYYLFGVPRNQIEILVHPQSIIHSMVEYQDGSVLAQMGLPDMRVPISYCMGYPERLETNVPSLDFIQIKNLSFEKPDETRFPAIRLAREALAAGNTMPTIMNAANETAVSAFLDGKISFGRITEIIDAAMQRIENAPLNSIAGLVAADSAARQAAGELT